MDIARCFELFQTDRKIRGCSESTLVFYDYVIGKLLRHIEEINLDGVRLSPHTLRHSFALAYIENGGDPFSLQRILGHTDQTTTSKYVNMARTNVKSQHSNYLPGERLG